MSSELKKRLTKTVSSGVTSTDVSQDVVKLERSYTTIGVSSDQKSSVETSPAFPSLGSSACYQREASSLSTASLPGGSPVKSLSKSRIPIATFSRENLSSGRSTPSNLTKLQKPGFGSLNSCNTLGLSTSSLAESLTGTSPFKYSKNGLGQQQVNDNSIKSQSGNTEQGKCRLTNEYPFFLFQIGRWYYEKNIWF